MIILLVMERYGEERKGAFCAQYAKRILLASRKERIMKRTLFCRYTDCRECPCHKPGEVGSCGLGSEIERVWKRDDKKPIPGALNCKLNYIVPTDGEWIKPVFTLATKDNPEIWTL